MTPKKLPKQILSGSKNINFNDIVTLVEAFGFTLSRVNGSHHIFIHPQISELVNIQNAKGKAKPYKCKGKS